MVTLNKVFLVYGTTKTQLKAKADDALIRFSSSGKKPITSFDF